MNSFFQPIYGEFPVQCFSKWFSVSAFFLVNVKETLSEFWSAKSADRDGLSDIRYESETRKDGSCVCFVTLPGGSCFGSFEECRTTSEAQKSAAKIALVHSVFNDHASRCELKILLK